MSRKGHSRPTSNAVHYGSLLPVVKLPFDAPVAPERRVIANIKQGITMALAHNGAMPTPAQLVDWTVFALALDGLRAPKATSIRALAQKELHSYRTETLVHQLTH